MSDTFSLAVLAALGCAIALMVIVLGKVRRIHLAMYQVQDDAAVARRESGALFGQIHAFLALERVLVLPQSLPPMRGWAGSPDMLLVLAQHMLARGPKTVVECSSGVSTVVAARCCQLNDGGHVYSLEHDAEYAARTAELLQRHGLSDWATVIVAPLEAGSDGAHWYRDDALPAGLPPIDLLVVDGPPAGDDSTVRYPALPRLKSRMADRFTVMLDDADRPGERVVVDRWLVEFPLLRVSRPPCEKGLAVIESRT